MEITVVLAAPEGVAAAAAQVAEEAMALVAPTA
jgi:hypothetical protein